MSVDRIPSKAGLTRPTFHGWTTAARLDRVMLTLLVGSLFLERWDKDYYLSGRSPIPDPFFVVTAGAVAVYLLVRHDARAVARALPTGAELTLIGLVLLLGALSIFGLALGPLGFVRLPQVTKTFAHLAFFLVIALILGRTLAPVLVAFTMRAYLAFATFFAAVAVLQAIDVNALHTGISGRLMLGTRVNHGFDAPLSIYSEPAYLGYACLTAILIGLFLDDVRRSRATQAAIAVCAVALLLSLSAGALAIAALVAAVFLVSAGRRLERGTVIAIALTVVVMLVVAAASPVGRAAAHRANDIVSGGDPSAQYRRAVDEGAVDIWQESPVFGVGLGDTRFLLPKYVHLSFLPKFNAEFVDSSTYLQLLAETGPLGVAAFVVALVVLLRRRKGGGRLEDLTRALLMVTALEALVISPFIRPWFWFATGLRLAMLAVDGSREESAPTP